LHTAIELLPTGEHGHEMTPSQLLSTPPGIEQSSFAAGAMAPLH
jgi:hypothetical protein